MKKLKLSQRQIEALQIINDNPKIHAREFAEKFWVNHRMHRKVSNQGDGGACIGKAGWLCGGNYVGKLKKKGLVKDYYDWDKKEFDGYEITEAGKALLN